ncbi:MAG TPA: STAS domain-containing protein [Verrucomicrobiae bacterium]|jgi:anti-sigma B factor antagonist
MKISEQDSILNVSQIPELGAANSENFRNQVRAALAPSLKAIEVDLSDTSFLDSCGLGALISVYKLANSQPSPASFRVLNPQPPVLQILELTRLHRLFEIVKR